jgi:hypothetical protein
MFTPSNRQKLEDQQVDADIAAAKPNKQALCPTWRKREEVHES